MIACFRCLGLALCLLLSASGALVAQAPEAPGQRLDGARLILDQIESGLKRGDLSDNDLQRLRAQIDPVSAATQGVLDELAPQFDAVKSRLDQLGPKPGDKAPPESESAAADRAEQEKRLKPVDELMRKTRLLGVEIEQISANISSRRRALFARALFERSTSVLSPGLWLGVIQEMPADFNAFQVIFSDWLGFFFGALSGWKLFQLIGALALLGAAYAPIARIAQRIVSGSPAEDRSGELQRVMAALRVIIARGILPIAAIVIFRLTLEAFGVLTMRILPLFKAVTDGAASVAMVSALAFALVSPGRPNLRLVPVSDAAAERAVRFILAILIIIFGGKVIEAINDIIAASLPLSVAVRGAAALSAGLALVYALRAEPVLKKADADGVLPSAVTGSGDLLGPFRLALWGAALLVIGASLVGYIALASFLVDQIVWISAIGSCFFLLKKLVNEGSDAAFTLQTKAGRFLTANLGLRRESLNQIGVILSGAAQVALLLIAALLLVAPWGIESQDMVGSLKAAFFGFKVGDVTISLSTLVIAVLLFAGVILATRSIQRWLEIKFLPHTHLDTGLQNSIRTSLGYLGFVIAVSLGLSHLGFNSEKLAIVAGALSVGIGFGLQTIVNNFVSGLILLWERAIRVGDWIVVGDEQGFVRRINVRSTEIETFDRATVIVPNASLVAGVVKNWVRTDRIGRIKIEIGVAYESDPEQVHDLLIDCAKLHKLVLAIPAPVVLFISFGDSALHFELICFVDDVETGGRVKSDLHFDIIKRLRSAGISIPYPQRDMNLRGLEKIEAALAQGIRQD